MNKKINKTALRRPLSVVRKGLMLTFILISMTVNARAEAPAKKATPVKKELTVADIANKVQEAQTAARDAQMDLNMEMKDTLSGQQQKHERYRPAYDTLRSRSRSSHAVSVYH